MPTVDNLNIEISAQANEAKASLDTLIRSLDKVSASLSSVNSRGLATMGSGVNKLANSMNNFSKNTKTTDFSRLSRNLTTIASIDTSNFSAVAGGISSMASAFNQMGTVSQNAVQIGEVAKNISKLGNKSVVQAIDNIPKLAVAMKDLMTTLSKAPAVSQNVIQMTNALAALASNGSRVGSSSRSLVNGLTMSSNAMGATKKQSRSLASSFGRLYANYWLLIRAGQSLGKSVKSSMNYIETLNYFNAAFEQVAESAVSEMGKAGSDSANSYFEAFSDTAKQLTQKMTGFAITDSGMLQSGTGKSLGIDPNQLMQYQAMFAQMSSSIGITADTSVKLSQALTEIGADLASVKNMDFNKVWTDMASGLAGMSRTLDKYGVNIRNVNLQEKLHELGINANISALNQNDKALLRTIILLDSTRYAWGDLADTIDQPANQLRMLQNNFSNLARTIGNIFLPIVAKVLPYVNMLVVALQKLAEFIVNLLGFEGFDWGGISGGSSDVMSDLYDSVADTGEALDSATGSAKKLKHQLQGFDELNVISSQEDSSGSGSSGIGGGINTGLLEDALDKVLAEYQKTWDEAFDNMESRYDSFANHVADAFKTGGLESVGSYLSTELANQLETIDWQKVYKGASGFGSGFASFLNGIFDNDADLLGSVGKTIASGLNTAIYTALSFGETFDFEGFGKAIASGVNNFFGTFDFGALADTVDAWVQGVWTTVKTAIGEIKWENVWNGAKEFLCNLDIETVGATIGILTITQIGGFVLRGKAAKMASTLIKNAIEVSLSGITLSQIALNIESFALGRFGVGTPLFDAFGSWVISGIEDVIETLLPQGIADAIGKAIAGISIGGIAGSWLPGLGTLAGAIVGGLVATIPDLIQEKLFNFDWAKQWFDEALNSFETAFDGNRANFLDIGYWILDGILSGFVGAFIFITEPIADLLIWIKDGICAVFGIESPAKEMKPLGKYILLGIVEGFTGAFPSMTKEIKNFWSDCIKPWFTTEKWEQNIGSVKNALSSKWTEAKRWWNNKADLSKISIKVMNIKSELSEAWSKARKWWNENKPSLSEIVAKIKLPHLKVTWDVEGTAAKALQKLGLKGFPNFSVAYYATGGFPEDGWFRANHGEIMGKFDNGKSVVANNMQITEGISDAVYRGNQENNALMRQEIAILQKQNELLAQLLEKETGISSKELFSSVKNSAKEYTARTGRPAFS